MDVRGRSRVLGVILLVGLAPTLLAQGAPAPEITPALSPEAMEAFLLKARVSSMRDAGSGVTNSRRATLTDGQLTHDVHIQTVDIAQHVFESGRNTELNFKDTYRYNIAGYRLAKAIGLTTVPMSVERTIEGKIAAVTWWVDDVKMDEKERMKTKDLGPDPVRTNKQIQIMRIWDELIQNRDRNQGNILWTSDWTLWLIDHTRAFRSGGSLLKPAELLRVERTMFNRIKQLTEAELSRTMKGILTPGEIQPILKRRDAIVALFEKQIAERGEVAVFFTLSPPAAR
jgi:hypothetical protein